MVWKAFEQSSLKYDVDCYAIDNEKFRTKWMYREMVRAVTNIIVGLK